MYSKNGGGSCGGKDSFKTEQIPMGYRPKPSFLFPEISIDLVFRNFLRQYSQFIYLFFKNCDTLIVTLKI